MKNSLPIAMAAVNQNVKAWQFVPNDLKENFQLMKVFAQKTKEEADAQAEAEAMAQARAEAEAFAEEQRMGRTAARAEAQVATKLKPQEERKERVTAMEKDWKSQEDEEEKK